MGSVSWIRIGVGAGFSDDRIDPAVDLAERGALDFLVFECLAERTMALAHLDRARNANSGFDPLLEERMRAVMAPSAASRTRLITNAGAANPVGAARVVAAVAHDQGLHLRIGVVLGDDVTEYVDGEALCANAYLGSEGIITALEGGADVVISGRVADASLFAGALCFAHGWGPTDWDNVGTAVAVGHLLECAGQLTGGYFAQPGINDVPDLAHIGFPVAEVDQDRSVVLTKLVGSGGHLSVDTCIQQLFYEVHDPTSYLSPDATVDFSKARFCQVADNRVTLSGITAGPPPDQLKVSVGRQAGYVGEGEISYAGSGCVSRAQLAIDILKTRVVASALNPIELRFDLIGVNSVNPAPRTTVEPSEVRLRAVGRFADSDTAEKFGREVTGLLLNGPAGGGGGRRHVIEKLVISSMLVPRAAVRTTVEFLET